MEPRSVSRRLLGATEPFGRGALRLRIGPWAIRFRGLDPAEVAALLARWGPFAGSEGEDPGLEVSALRAGPGSWLTSDGSTSAYRIEAARGAGEGTVVSHHFALARGEGGGWRLAVTEGAEEPFPRIVENAARLLVGRLAAEAGGMALHGAGVLRNGVTHVFAGPSRSGKSTASRLSFPARSLGDDFAVVLPEAAGWVAAAVPFDNAEAISSDRATGIHPLASVWRIFQEDAASVERPKGALGVASLLSCAAFPWAIPDLSERIGEAAHRIVEAGRFGHLRFRVSGDFWERIDEAARGGC